LDLPGWQTFYQELKGKNFEIISVAEDTGGVKMAGEWIAKAKPEYTVLIDDKHLVTQLYNLVNVPMGVWINEQGRLVRPPEAAYVDNRYKSLHGLDAAPYLEALRDWVEKGERSQYVVGEEELKKMLTPPSEDRARADAEFALAEYLYSVGRGEDAIAHFKEAQRLDPENWNYKRQAWQLSDAERDYGTSFMKEVQKLQGKPYYKPRRLPQKQNQ
jgi:tetratricopeptide (TPR) repeat protein